MCLVGLASATAAERQGPVITNPDEAGVDFAVQGEYQGQADTDEGRQKVAAQVVALGQGEFRLVGLRNGLPGDGWTPGAQKEVAEAKGQEGSVTFDLERAVVKLADGVISVIADGEELGKLPKVNRQSPTLGAKPPAGAVILFDGTSADNFVRGKLVEGNLLAASDCYSKEEFGDHSMHLEFRTPFMPEARGQGRGNSGVYIQRRYELQILDSFGLDERDNECGGFYSVAAPRVNMCYPPLSWQTYDIDFTAAQYDANGEKTRNARVTVRHNGVAIHDNLELPHDTPGGTKEGPGRGPLFLQDHGNPVVFRNIWVVAK